MYIKLQKLEDEYGILKDENIQKELNIKKYEEDLSNFEKENEELSIQILQEKEKDNNRFNNKRQVFRNESLNEDKINELNKENSNLNIKIRNLEKEFKLKIDLLSDFKEKTINIEKENFLLNSKIKLLENCSEKIKNENLFLKKENLEFKNIIQNLEKKVEELNKISFFSNENETLSKIEYETCPIGIHLNDLDLNDEKVMTRRSSKLNM